jgi:hypothetical protein
MYSPELKMWTTPEQNGADYVDGPNLYDFVRNNPVNRVDPTGEKHIVVVFEGLITDPKVRYAQGLGQMITDKDKDAMYIYKDQDDASGIADALKQVGEAASSHHPVFSGNPGSKGKLVTCFHDTVIVIGFSFGGDAAIQFANDLKKTYGITVAAGLTIDPRRRPLGQFAEIPFGQPSAESWTNFWEQGDRWLRGTEISGVQNIELKKDDFKEFVTPEQVVAAISRMLEMVSVEKGHQ